MRFGLLLVVICCSVASPQIQAGAPSHYVIKSDGTVYDCDMGPISGGGGEEEDEEEEE